MSEYESSLRKAAEAVGTWMMISGLLVLGPIGFVILSILAYAMYFSNMALVVVCIMLLATPLALMTAWIPLLAGGLLAERMAATRELAAETNST
jgi:hypothetical protein